MPNSLAIAAANLPGLPTTSAAGTVLPQSGATDFSALLLSLTPSQFQPAGTPTTATEKPAKISSTAATIDVSMDPSRLLYMGGTIPANLAGTPSAATPSTTPTNSGSPAGPSSQSLEDLPLQQFDVRSIQIETELLPQSIQAALPGTAAAQISKFVPDVNATLTPDVTASKSDATDNPATPATPASPVFSQAPAMTKAGPFVRAAESKILPIPGLTAQFAAQSKETAETAPQQEPVNMAGNQHAKIAPELSTVSTAMHTTETVFQSLTANGTGSTTPQDAVLQLKGTAQMVATPSKSSDAGVAEVSDFGFIQAPDTPQYSQSVQNPSATASAIVLDTKTVLKAGAASDFGSRDSSKDSDDAAPSSTQTLNTEATGAASHTAVFATNAPATTVATSTPQAAAPAPATPQGDAGWAPQVPVAARRVSIDVGEGDSSVRITIHERAGDISVKIDSATDTLHGQLQSSAGTLVDALRREQVPLANLDFSSMPDNSANPDQRRQRNPNSQKSAKAAVQSDPAILGDSVNLQS